MTADRPRATRRRCCATLLLEARDPLVVWVKIDPRFAKVRHAARIQAIIARIGL